MYTKLLAYGLDNIISWSSYVCNAIKELFIVSFIQVIYNDCNLNNMINLIPSKHLKLSTTIAKKIVTLFAKMKFLREMTLRVRRK